MQSGLKWKESSTASQTLDENLPWLTGSLIKSGSKLGKGRDSTGELHKFRLRVKKCRYLLELFEPCNRKETRERIQALKQLQDELGAITDCRTTIDILQSSRLSGLPGVPELVARLGNIEQKRAETFRQTWRGKLSSAARHKF